jgi:hypothetical protein
MPPEASRNSTLLRLNTTTLTSRWHSVKSTVAPTACNFSAHEQLILASTVDVTYLHPHIGTHFHSMCMVLTHRMKQNITLPTSQLTGHLMP